MKQSLFLILLICISELLFAQTCEVKSERLSGAYAGDCKNGKAEGKGTATGVDVYEGLFKNGYPDGYGVYMASDKSTYKGNFKKGFRDGAGELVYKTQYGSDSVITGFWKKDKYIGQYEKPYEVHTTTAKVNRLDFINKRKEGNSIYFTLHAITWNPTLLNIDRLKGNFVNRTNQKLSNSTSTRLQMVDFPFRAIYYLNNNESFEVTFFEQGDWDVSVQLN